MWSFLGRQFYCSTLYKAPIALGFVHNRQLVDGLQQKMKTGFHETEMELCRLFWGDNFIVPPCIFQFRIFITPRPIQIRMTELDIVSTMSQ